MRQRATWAAMIVLMGALLPGPAAGQSPSPASPDPAVCGPATSLRFPLHDPGATLAVPFAFEDPALASPDAAFAGRFHPDETWILPSGTEGTPVFAAGPGLVVASGPIGAGDQGGIVVVAHAGPFTLPPSEPDDPFVHASTTTSTLLTVAAGIDPLVAVGDCVTADTVIGIITAACAPGVPPPCTDLPPGLRLEVRLGETADPDRRSADWSVVGAPEDSIGGTFPDPQRIVDDGVREPSRVFAALATPCPDPSADPSASPEPCEPPVPTGSPLPSSEPGASPSPAAPTPAPTARPVASPAVALQQGLPKGVRGTCEKRSANLVTGTLAAVDCRPGSPAIELMSFFLGRPVDSRFTFNHRAREQKLGDSGDCAGSVPGVESRKASLALLCYRDAKGRANLRFAISDTCPAVYVGVLGTGKDIGALAAAVDELTGGTIWRRERATVSACANDDGRVSAPPAPSRVHLSSRPVRPPTAKDPYPPLRARFTWDIPVTADTTVEIWGVRKCLRTPPKDASVPCIGKSTRIPSSQLVLLGSAPAGAGEVSWLVPLDEIMGGMAFHDPDHGWFASVVARAVNDRARSPFALIPEALGEACDGCVY